MFNNRELSPSQKIRKRKDWVPASAGMTFLRENKTFRINSSIQTGKKLGMQLMDDHLWELFEADKISLETMIEKARQPGQILEKIEATHKGNIAEVRKAIEELGPILEG